jgi:hypothetical protein
MGVRMTRWVGRKPRISTVIGFAAALCATCSFTVLQAFAEVVGKAVSIKTTVTGARGPLKTADPVSRDERIRTNTLGLGQFKFIDGTKLVIGPNSNVVIDQYVLGQGSRVKKLVIAATRGTFRWISGRSPPSAYEIRTPAGTLGVRGTAVDISVRNNIAMMVLLSGSGRWCNDRGCVVVDRPCDFIIARRGQEISEPQPVNRAALSEAGRPTAFPYLINNKQLVSSFRLGRTNCGLGRRVEIRTNFGDQRRTERQARPPSGSD